MNRLLLPLAVVMAAIGLAVGEFAYRYPQLPAQVASHFDAQGQANDWMSKRQFATFSVGMLAMLSFTFAMACVAVSVAPTSVINLPRKDYWLAPERASETRRMIVERLLWFTAATMLFMAYISHEVLAVNLGRNAQVTVWAPLGVFLTFTAVWCGELFWRFNRAPVDSVR